MADNTPDNQVLRNFEDSEALTHYGWMCLANSDVPKAIISFQSALQINPDFEWAREGLVESLKARHRFYSLLLHWSFWLDGINGGIRAIIAVGLILCPFLLLRVSETYPAFAPVTWPPIFLCLALGLWTWLANPIVSLLLLLEPAGRQALPTQRRQALIVSSTLIAAALVLLTVNLILQNAGLGFSAFGVGLFAIPLTMTLKSPRGWPRITLAALSIVLALVGLLTAGILLVSAISSVNVLYENALVISGILIFFGGIPLSMILASIVQVAHGRLDSGDGFGWRSSSR